MTVYLLTCEGWEECRHYGVFSNVDAAKATAQGVDDAWNPYPGWEESGRPRGTLEWFPAWSGRARLEARGCGFNRHWMLYEEHVMNDALKPGEDS